MILFSHCSGSFMLSSRKYATEKSSPAAGLSYCSVKVCSTLQTSILTYTQYCFCLKSCSRVIQLVDMPNLAFSFSFPAVGFVLFAARSAVQMGPFRCKVLQTVYAKCFIFAHSLHICAMILWPGKYLFACKGSARVGVAVCMRMCVCACGSYVY